MDALTDRQAEILRLIKDLTEVSGYPPTRAEIAERMGFRSVNAAEQHLRALEKKGAIDIAEGASRGIRVRDGRASARGGRLLELPVIGRVAARRLPAARARHVDARRRDPGRRPARGASHRGGPLRTDHRGAPRGRSYGK